MKRTALALAAAALAAAPLAAQQQPPPPGPLRPYHVPQPAEFRLPNGVRVVVVRQATLPIVDGRIMVTAGAAAEPADKAGLASLTGDLLNAGIPGVTSTDIARRMELLGADFSTGASYSYAFADVTATKSAFPQAMALAARTVTEPTFPEDEFQLARTRAISDYVQSHSTVDGLASEAFQRAVFEPGAPYARQPGGTQATLQGLTRADVVDWHRRMYSPANTTLLLTGDITPDEARTIAQAALGAWTAPPAQVPPLSNPAQKVAGTRVILVDRPGSVQSGVMIGQAAIGMNDPRYFPTLALSQVLGGGFKARVNMDLREAHGWTYGAFTQLAALNGAGYFAIASSVRTNATDSAVAEAVKQYRRISAEPVPAEELRLALANVVGSFPNSVQTVQGLSQRVQSLVLYGLPVDYYSTYRERVAAVTPGDVARMGHGLLTPDALTIVVAGDLSKIEQPIRALNLGTVEVRDAEGNKVR